MPCRSARCSPGHGGQAQIVGALLGQREADEAASVARHEVDGLRGDELGGQRQVALVLAVLVVDHHNHAPRANLRDGLFHAGEGGLVQWVRHTPSLDSIPCKSVAR